MFPRLTAEVHIKLFLRANSNLFIFWQKEAAKDKIEGISAHSAGEQC